MEGISEEIIREALKNAGYQPAGRNDERLITKQDLFRDGLYGKQNSSSLRAELLNGSQLPARLSVNGLLEVLIHCLPMKSIRYSYQAFLKIPS